MKMLAFLWGRWSTGGISLYIIVIVTIVGYQALKKEWVEASKEDDDTMKRLKELQDKEYVEQMRRELANLKAED